MICRNTLNALSDQLCKPKSSSSALSASASEKAPFQGTFTSVTGRVRDSLPMLHTPNATPRGTFWRSSPALPNLEGDLWRSSAAITRHTSRPFHLLGIVIHHSRSRRDCLLSRVEPDHDSFSAKSKFSSRQNNCATGIAK